MDIFLDGKPITLEQLEQNFSGTVLCFSHTDDKRHIIEKLYNLSSKEHPHMLQHTGQSYFESFPSFDLMSLKVPDINDLNREPRIVEIYFSADRLLFLHDDESFMKGFVDSLPQDSDELVSLENILHAFFLKITEGDIVFLEDVEDKIEELEDSLTEGKSKDNYSIRITKLRKELLVLKRYYEGFSFLLDGVEENRNGVISDDMMRNFHFFANRVDRLLRTVLNLRDYVTQVREAYQAQIDIQQNEIMQYFTIVTTIFLPLTVIAGWYGMNFDMPEYGFKLAYPIVIIVSAIFVIASIIIFKRRKWF